MTRRRLLGLLLVLGLLVPARADTVDDVVALIREASATPNPAMAFLRGLGRLGDFTLDQAALRRALVESGAPQGGMIERVLAGTRTLTKRGREVQLDRTEETLLSPLTADGKGAVKLGKKVKLRVTVQGDDDALLDEVKGIEVGEAAGSLYDLWKVAFTKEGSRPVAKVTAGTFVFSKTVTIDLTPKPKPAAPATPATEAPAPTPVTEASPTPATESRPAPATERPVTSTEAPPAQTTEARTPGLSGAVNRGR